MLDESHCSVHTYADLGMLAMDIFTCGQTDPLEIWETVRRKLSIKSAYLRTLHRFEEEKVALT
jgi:S-adenosylmethionine decarboxylase